MKLVVSLLTLLVVSNIGAQRIKGGGGLLTSPRVFGGKVGGGGAVHHTAVVQDPLSGAPVVVSKVSPFGGVKGGGLGAGSVQLSVGDGLFGNRGLYRVGQSQIPYGLLGMDYGSYPASLLTAPRSLRRKTIVSDNLSGLRPVGFGSRLAGPSKIGGGGALHHTAVVQDPLSGAPVVVSQVSPIGGVKGGGLGAGSVQLSVGDGLFGNRGLYRVGQSQIPYGLLGMDYGSYPTSLLTSRRGLGKTILSDNLSGLRPVGFGGKLGGGGALHHTAVVQDPLLGAPVVVSKVSPIGGVKGGGLGAGSVQLSVGDGLFGNRGLYRVGQSQIPYGLLGMDYGSYPTSLLSGRRGLGKTILSDNLSGLRPVGFGGKLGGGGALHHTAVVQDPLSGAPVVVSKVSPIGGVKSGGLGAGSVQLSVGDGLFGNRGLYRVGQSQVPFGLLGMDYGSYPTSFLTGRRGLGKTILSDNLSGLRPVGYGGKIGGLTNGGLSGIGATQTTIVQEEDPFTGTVTTSQISQVAQDPIETAIQESLADAALSQSVQSLVDPLGSGQTQVAVDDFGGVTQVKETIVSDPLTGELNKVTEVTKSGGALAQQNIADSIVQENIASGLGRANLGAYLPRLSFLSQYPYDFSDAGVLRSIVSRPLIQQQQEVEQILVK